MSPQKQRHQRTRPTPSTSCSFLPHSRDSSHPPIYQGWYFTPSTRPELMTHIPCSSDSMHSLPPTGTLEGSSTRDRGGTRAPKAPCVFIGALSPLWSFLPSIPLLLLNFHCVFKYSLCTRPSCSYARGVFMSKVLTVCVTEVNDRDLGLWI